MTKRFFKLLYVLALIAIGLFLPIYILTSIDYESITRTSYKAKCISNQEYVVIQGSAQNDAWVFDEISYDDKIYNDIKRDLNFYCKYYSEIQPHILAYNQADTRQGQVKANQEFFNFKQNVIDSIFDYPASYKLEVVRNEFQPYKIYGPIIDGLVIALGAFILLQIIRICYVYIVFGKVFWHPFRKIPE